MRKVVLVIESFRSIRKCRSNCRLERHFEISAFRFALRHFEPLNGFAREAFCFSDLKKSAPPWLENTPPQRTGGAAALKLRVHLNLAGISRVTPVMKFLSPRLTAYIGDFGSAAATKCVSPAAMTPYQI